MKYEEYAKHPPKQRSPEQIEQDLSQIRGEMRDTLHALEDKLSMKELKQRVHERTQHGKQMLATGVHDVKESVREHPLPWAVAGGAVSLAVAASASAAAWRHRARTANRAYPGLEHELSASRSLHRGQHAPAVSRRPVSAGLAAFSVGLAAGVWLSNVR